MKQRPSAFQYGGASPIAFPAYEFNLSDLPAVTLYPFPYRVSIRLRGKLLIQKDGIVSHFNIKDLRKIELKAREETKSRLHSLANDVSVSFDAKTRKLDFSCGFTSTLKLPGGQELKHRVEVGPSFIRFVCDPVYVRGIYDGYLIEGSFGYEVKVEGEGLSRTQNRVPTTATSFHISEAEPFVVGILTFGLVGIVLLFGGLSAPAAAGAMSFVLALDLVR